MREQRIESGSCTSACHASYIDLCLPEKLPRVERSFYLSGTEIRMYMCNISYN